MAGKMSRILLLAIAGPVFLSGTRVVAQSNNDTSDPEDMKREIRALKLQVQSLRAAMAEAADSARLRANALARALGPGGVPPPAAETPTTPRKEKEAPRRGRGAKAAVPAPTVRHAQAEAPAGTIRGKVD